MSRSSLKLIKDCDNENIGSYKIPKASEDTTKLKMLMKNKFEELYKSGHLRLKFHILDRVEEALEMFGIKNILSTFLFQWHSVQSNN